MTFTIDTTGAVHTFGHREAGMWGRITVFLDEETAVAEGAAAADDRDEDR